MSPWMAVLALTQEIPVRVPRTLHAGDAFYEPANTKILHFDANNATVKFVAYYLLGKE